jgi:hypothetical protein
VRDIVEYPKVAPQLSPRLYAVLESLGISQYTDILAKHGFTSWKSMLNIREDDFEKLGVKRGHRRKLQRQIAISIKKTNTPISHHRNDPLPLEINKRKNDEEHERSKKRYE